MLPNLSLFSMTENISIEQQVSQPDIDSVIEQARQEISKFLYDDLELANDCKSTSMKTKSQLRGHIDWVLSIRTRNAQNFPLFNSALSKCKDDRVLHEKFVTVMTKLESEFVDKKAKELSLN